MDSTRATPPAAKESPWAGYSAERRPSTIAVACEWAGLDSWDANEVDYTAIEARLEAPS